MEHSEWVDNVVIKKVFIDTYNPVLRFLTFVEGKGLHEDDWVLPPTCVQEITYCYVVFFYEWIVKGQWQMQSDSKEEESDY